MNTLKTTDNGGFPLTLNDFRWIDNGIREAFKGLMSGYGVTDSEAVIISGCERTVTSGTVSIAAGFISISGEICIVPAHTYPEPSVGQFEYWDLYTYFDSEGYKVFQSTLDFNTYQGRAAKVTVASSIPAGYTEYADTKNIFQITRIKINTDSWHNLVDTTNGIDTWSIEFKKDSSEFVHLRGFRYEEDPVDGLQDLLIATLPVGYRPEVEKEFILGQKTGSGGDIDNISGVILTNGEIRFRSVEPAAAYLIDFSQITPFEGV